MTSTNRNDFDLSPHSRELAVDLNDEDVDDALNFGMDFDAVTSTNDDNGLSMGDLGLGLEEYAGSMGTRSPSPKGFSLKDDESLTSNASKRSRADFEDESSLSDGFDTSNKRRASMNITSSSRGGTTMGLGGFDQNDDQNAEGGQMGGMGLALTPQQIRLDREREGRCPDCGLDTHRMVKSKGQRIVREALTIEGEVLNGRCLFCHPLDGSEPADKKISAKSEAAKKTSRKGTKKKGKSSSKSSNDSQHSDRGNGNELNQSFSEVSDGNKGGSRPPSRPSSRSTGSMGGNMGSNNNNNNMMGMSRMGMMGMDNNMTMQNTPQQHHQQRQQMAGDMDGRFQNTPQNQDRQGMGGMQSATPQSNHHQRFSPRSDRSGRSMISSASNNPQSMGMGMRASYSNSNFGPNSGHARSALMKQRQLPRKHSAMQHAKMAFGRAARRGSARQNYSHANNSSSNARDSRGMPMSNAANDGIQQLRSNLSSASLVNGGDANSLSNSMPNIKQEGDDISRNSHRSEGGRLGKAMAMGMGMNCAELTPNRNQQHGMQSPKSRSPMYGSGHPDPPSSTRTNNHNALLQSASSDNDGSARQQSRNENAKKPTRPGESTPAARIAHSKLASNIYHHHGFPMPKEVEQALMDKTLMYLESGGGDISDIISAMRRFPFSLPIQSVACEKLYVHCFDRDHAHAIGLVGGIRTVVDAMEHHPTDVALQRGCAGIIKHLACASPYNLEMLDRMGAVTMIVTAMERHVQNAPLQESCCWALESIARGSTPEIKMRVAKSGGIHLAMKSVETFPENESLLRAAFHCLRQLGYNPSSYNSNNPRMSQGGSARGGDMHGMMGPGGPGRGGMMQGRGGMGMQGEGGMQGNGMMQGRGGMGMQGDGGMQGGSMMQGRGSMGMQGDGGMQGNGMMQGRGSINMGMQGDGGMQNRGGMQGDGGMQGRGSMQGDGGMQRNGNVANNMGGMQGNSGMMMSPNNNMMGNNGMRMPPNNNMLGDNSSRRN